MWLNCKLKKKCPPAPHFYIELPFQAYPPFLAKNFVPPLQVTQFLEGSTLSPSLIRGRDVPTMAPHCRCFHGTKNISDFVLLEAATFVGKFSSHKTQRTQTKSIKRFRIIKQAAVVIHYLSLISFSLYKCCNLQIHIVVYPHVYRSCHTLIFDSVFRYAPLWHIDTMSICSKEGEKTEIQFNILKSGFHLPKVLIYFNKSLKKRQKMLLILC